MLIINSHHIIYLHLLQLITLLILYFIYFLLIVPLILNLTRNHYVVIILTDIIDTEHLK